MLDFLITLLICTITVSLVALIFIMLSPFLSKRYKANWLYFAWIVIIIAYIFPIRPAFDYKSYNPISPVFITQEDLASLPNYTHDVGDSTAYSAVSYDYYWIFYIWLVGLLAVLGFHIIRYIRFLKLTRRWSEEVNAKPEIIEILHQVSEEMGITKQVKIFICPLLASPMMTGFINPRILLPGNDFSNEELTFILTHELTHYKRRDLWYKALALLSTAVHWFNPAVYLVARTFHIECELSCDEEVLRGSDKEIRQKYSKTIIGTIPRRNKFKTALSTSFQGGKSTTKRRISAILEGRKKQNAITVIIVVLFCIVLSGAALAGHLHPSAQYYERKWSTNTLWAERTFEKEPQSDNRFPFMGAIRISYYIHNDSKPSWANNMSFFQISVSAYDTIVIKGLDLSSREDVDAFADYQLSIKYCDMKAKGFTDNKPGQSEYTYEIEIPEDLTEYHIEDFYKKADSPSPSEIGYEVTYKLDGRTFVSYLPPKNPNLPPDYPDAGSVEERAKKAIEKHAKQIGITLPDNFAENIIITPAVRRH